MRLLAPDLKSYTKTVKYDSSLTTYEVDSAANTIWLTTRGGNLNKEVVAPKLYRVSLDGLTNTEVVLDSIPVTIGLSGDGKWLAVGCLGSLVKNTSVLTLFEAETLKQVAAFEVAKNPGVVSFNNDNTRLVVTSYGSQEGYKVPTSYYIKMEQPTPAGACVINLETLQSKSIALGAVAQEIIVAENASAFSVAKDETGGTVKSVGPAGLLWEKKSEFLPEYIQERPGTDQVFIIGGKSVSIIERQSGSVVREIKAENDLKPFLFLENSALAYTYNASKRKLSILDLEKLEIKKTLTAGSTLMTMLKVLDTVTSVINYHNTLQPQFLNGVHIPHRVSKENWPHSPSGPMVACPEQNRLFLLNSNLGEINVYDMQKGIMEKRIKGVGEHSLSLQMSPNRKFLILISADGWRLINPSTNKTVLKFNPAGISISFVGQAITQPTPRFSLDGSKMYIADGSKVTIIDLVKGKKLPAISTQAKNALISW